MNRTAFIFDDVRISPDKQIGLHSNNNWELSYVLVGSGTRTIGDRSEPFYPGEVILIPPNIPHAWRFNPADTDENGNIANISVFFDTSTLESLKMLIPEMSAALGRIWQLDYAISYTGKRQMVLQRILSVMREKTPEERVPLMINLLIEISVISDGLYAGRKNKLSRTEQKLETVRVYCACNYSRQIALDEMSRHVGMNKSAFCTFMRNNAGSSFSEYLNDMRLERAKVMLCNTDKSIAEIAMDCGFQSVTYFNRLFKRRYKCTPKEIRISRPD